MVDAGLVLGVLDHGRSGCVPRDEVALFDGQSDPVFKGCASERASTVRRRVPKLVYGSQSCLRLSQRERLGIRGALEVA